MHLFHLQLPNLRGHAWPSMGKSNNFMGQSALIVSLATREQIEKNKSGPSSPVRCSLVKTPSSVRSPHGVEDGPILHDTEQFVRSRHVVRNGPLWVSEERVRDPDLFYHAVVEPQDFCRPLEFQPLINPHLAEEHVHGVILTHRTQRVNVKRNIKTISQHKMLVLNRLCPVNTGPGATQQRLWKTLLIRQCTVGRHDETMMDATHHRQWLINPFRHSPPSDMLSYWFRGHQ